MGHSGMTGHSENSDQFRWGQRTNPNANVVIINKLKGTRRPSSVWPDSAWAWARENNWAENKWQWKHLAHHKPSRLATLRDGAPKWIPMYVVGGYGLPRASSVKVSHYKGIHLKSIKSDHFKLFGFVITQSFRRWFNCAGNALKIAREYDSALECIAVCWKVTIPLNSGSLSHQLCFQ